MRSSRVYILLLFMALTLPRPLPGAEGGMASLQADLDRLEAAARRTAAPETAALTTAGGAALLRIGGEINADYTAVIRDRGSRRPRHGVSSSSHWALHSTNLRFTMDFGNGVEGRIKLDFSETQPYLREQILEEALLIWKNICGGPFGVVFGKGEVPYGQDRTLGIIQSYHHNDGSYSAEGQTILNGPEPGMLFTAAAGAGPVWHPGETDRSVYAGITVDWEDIVRLEMAVFQPADLPERGSREGNSGFESLAARLWWQTPVEGLVLELSGIRKFNRERGDRRFGEYARQDSYAFSAGGDYFVPGTPLELFAEYEMGINWNFQSGYDTHTVSVGGLYQLSERIELGLMAEWLRIASHAGTWDYNKFVAHGRYNFRSGMYIIGEYGLETLNWGSATAHVFAVRSGIDF